MAHLEKEGLGHQQMKKNWESQAIFPNEKTKKLVSELLQILKAYFGEGLETFTTK